MIFKIIFDKFPGLIFRKNIILWINKILESYISCENILIEKLEIKIMKKINT